jgi:hypothetical protein
MNWQESLPAPTNSAIVFILGYASRTSRLFCQKGRTLGLREEWADFHALDLAKRKVIAMTNMLIVQNLSFKIAYNLMHLD